MTLAILLFLFWRRGRSSSRQPCRARSLTRYVISAPSLSIWEENVCRDDIMASDLNICADYYHLSLWPALFRIWYIGKSVLRFFFSVVCFLLQIKNCQSMEVQYRHTSSNKAIGLLGHSTRFSISLSFDMTCQYTKQSYHCVVMLLFLNRALCFLFFH